MIVDPIQPYSPNPYYNPPVPYYTPGGDRWLCPRCGGWVAWWVTVHHCIQTATTTTTFKFVEGYEPEYSE